MVRRHLSSIGDSDIIALARMLQKQGRGGDRILAHINAGEARLLKRRGGRGSRNPITGLLEFDDGADFVDMGGPAPEPVPSAPVDTTTSPPATGGTETVVVPGTYTGGTPVNQNMDVMNPATYFTPTPAMAPSTKAAPVPGPAAAPAPAPAAPAPTAAGDTVTVTGNAAPLGGGVSFGGGPAPAAPPAGNASWSSNVKNWVQNNQPLLSLGLLGGLGLFGGMQSAKAGQAGAQLQGQLANVAAPLQAAGQQELATTQAGGLTPSSLQVLQATQAQLGQAQAAGAISAQQVAQSISGVFAGLLQQQLNEALSILNQADTLLSNAFIQGYQANATAQANTSNFYMNLANLAARLPGIGSPSIAAAAPAATNPFVPASAPAKA